MSKLLFIIFISGKLSKSKNIIPFLAKDITIFLLSSNLFIDHGAPPAYSG